MWFGIISSQSVACLFISRSAGFLIRFTAAVGVLNSATLFLTHHAPAVLALFQFFLLLWDSCCPLCLEYSFSLCCSAAQSCLTPRNPMDYSTPGFLSFTGSWSLLKLLFVSCLINLCLPPNLESILIFSFRSLVLLAFVFRSLIHLRTISFVQCEVGIWGSFFLYGYPVVLTKFVLKISFFPLVPFFKNQMSICVSLFLDYWSVCLSLQQYHALLITVSSY